MGIAEVYLRSICDMLAEIVEKEERKIDKAAELLAEYVKQGKLIHVFGTGGHSTMGAMEVFWRAGGLAPINAIFPPGVSVSDSHPNTERLVGYAPIILKHYGVKEGDVLIIINVNGINPLTIDTALEARKLGAKVIAITSPDFAKNVPPGIAARHPSNKNLHELADIVLDAHVPPGDAILKIEGLEQKVGPSSTFAVCFLANLLMAKTVEKLVELGVEPPVWMSANVKGGDEFNKRYIEQYMGRVYHLYPM